MTLEAEVPAAPGWIAARCVGQQPRGSGMAARAHTSPVYGQVRGQPPRVERDAVAALLRYCDRMLGWIEREGRFETDKARADLTDVFHAAQDVLKGRLPTTG
jgi:hypothetical protein